MKYKVNFEYSIPQFTEIELDADNIVSAEDEAVKIFNSEYPEAIDFKVININE